MVEHPHSVLKDSVVVPVEVTLFLDEGGVRRSQANGVSPLQDEDGKFLDAGDAVKSAASDGLKRALMKYGLGAHLYHEQAESVSPKKSAAKPPSKTVAEEEEEDTEEVPAPKRKTTPAPKGGGDWASKREKFTVPIGKHKGTSYADVEAGWLQWYDGNVEREEKNARVYDCVQSEIKYRKDNGEWNPETKKKFGNSKPTKKRTIGAEDEEDEF